MAAPDTNDSRNSEEAETWADYALEMQSRRPVGPVLYDSIRGIEDDDLVIYNRNGSLDEWIQSDTYGVPAP